MILITTQCFPPEVGGIEILMAGLAENLAAAGEDVRVFADAAPGPDAPAAYRLTRFGGPKALRRRLKALAVARAARQPGVRGLFADSWKGVELLPRLPVPVAVFAHGAELPLHPSLAKRRRIERALARADRIIAVSAYTARRVLAYAPGAADRICMIHPPIPPQPQPSAEAARAIAALRRGGGPMLATVARLDPYKGIDTTIRAVAELTADHPGVVYAVAGAGADRARLEQMAEALGVADRVRFLGRVGEDEKAALLAGADLFVMPSRRAGEEVEGFGIVYVEAAWHGLAAIAGRDGGGAEAVEDGVTGLVVDADDQASVTAALRRLLDHPAEREAMQSAAAKRAREAFLWPQATPRFLAALTGA